MHREKLYRNLWNYFSYSMKSCPSLLKHCVCARARTQTHTRIYIYIFIHIYHIYLYMYMYHSMQYLAARARLTLIVNDPRIGRGRSNTVAN